MYVCTASLVSRKYYGWKLSSFVSVSFSRPVTGEWGRLGLQTSLARATGWKWKSNECLGREVSGEKREKEREIDREKERESGRK